MEIEKIVHWKIGAGNKKQIETASSSSSPIRNYYSIAELPDLFMMNNAVGGVRINGRIDVGTFMKEFDKNVTLYRIFICILKMRSLSYLSALQAAGSRRRFE